MLHRVAKAAHTPARSSHGHVCRACRRQRQRSQHIQRRWNSELSTNSSNGQGASADTWFDTLNDISDNYTSHVPEPTKPKKEKPRDERKAKAVVRKANPLSNLMKDLTGELGDEEGETVRPVESLSMRRKKEKALADKTGGSSLDMLRNQLQGISRPLGEKPTSSAASEELDLGTKDKISDFLKPSSRGKSPNLGQGVMLNDLDDLIDSLGMSAERKAIQQDVELEGVRASEIEGEATELAQPQVIPFPSFRGEEGELGFGGAVDNVRVPPGITKKDDSTDQHTPKVWKAKTSPAASGLGGRLSEEADSRTMPNIVWQSGRSKPAGKWGDVENQLPRSPESVTFDTLSKADKVSPKKEISSSTNSKPFGMAPASKLEEMPAATPAESDGTGTHPQKPGHLMGLLSGLRNKLTAPWGAGSTKPADQTESTTAPATQQSEGHVEEEAPQEPKQPEHPAFKGLSILHAQLQADTASSPDPATENDEVVRQATQSKDAVYTAAEVSGEPRTEKPFPGPNDWQNRPIEKPLTRRMRTQTLIQKVPTIRVPTINYHLSGGEPEQPEEVQGMSIADAMKSGGRMKGSGGGGGSSGAPRSSAILEDKPQVEFEEPTEKPGVQETHTLDLSDLEITPLDIPQPPVPYLEYGLDRVLFNPGVYQLKDPASRVYNFDPYLEKIMPAEEFDFNSLKEYKTSSQDKALATIALDQDKRYIGSTSSMTGTLAHFHHLISNWRPLNHDMISKGFAKQTMNQVTKINKAPNAIFLRWKNGSYAIDADKEYDSPNVLMLLGKSMELLLTLPTDEYEKYRKSDPRQVSEESRTAPEAYQYTTMGDFLMRSQLDAYDPRLPGNGTFDLKTRAVVSVRMRAWEHEEMTGYEIRGLQGHWHSYEREYYDMTRSTMLKYMLQARMGRMNGIFVAYHNVERMFGFQYVPISEMDRVLHGQTDACLGDQEFKASLKILNEILNKATAKFPEQSLRLHFETQEPMKKGGEEPLTVMQIFAEPMTEDEVDEIQNKSKEKIEEFERNIMGKSASDETTSEEPIPNDAQEAIEAAGSANIVDEQVSAEPKEDDLSPTDGTNETVDEATAAIREGIEVKSSSDSDADKPFLNKIETQNSENLKPLFYATILVQSQVKGTYLDPQDRPSNLRKGDKWEINYLIKEYETTPSVWAQYEDCKARRRFAFDHDAEEEDAGDPESEARQRKSDGYITFLKGLSEDGRKIRSKLDRLDQGKDVVRVEDPLPRYREKVESLEDYMSWMYKQRE